MAHIEVFVLLIIALMLLKMFIQFKQVYMCITILYYVNLFFTFMHLADFFIQSHCIAFNVYIFTWIIPVTDWKLF